MGCGDQVGLAGDASVWGERCHGIRTGRRLRLARQPLVADAVQFRQDVLPGFDVGDAGCAFDVGRVFRRRRNARRNCRCAARRSLAGRGSSQASGIRSVSRMVSMAWCRALTRSPMIRPARRVPWTAASVKTTMKIRKPRTKSATGSAGYASTPVSSNSPAKWHRAKWPGRASVQAGVSVRHLSSAYRQRGWK